MKSFYVGKAALPALLLSVSALAGCTIPLKPPPQISYDDEAQPAVQLGDPPKPVGRSSNWPAKAVALRVQL